MGPALLSLLLVSGAVEEVREGLATADTALVLGMRAEGAVAEIAPALDDVVATEVQRAVPRLTVVTGADLTNVANLEAEQQRVGCDLDNTSCLADLAGALGTRLIVLGTASELSGLTSVNLALYDAERVLVVSRATARADTATALPAELRAATRALLEGAGLARPPAAEPAAPRAAPAPRWPGLGVGLLVSGSAVAVGCGGVAFLGESWLRDLDSSGGRKSFARSYGLSAFFGAVAGGAVALTGAGLMAWGGE